MACSPAVNFSFLEVLKIISVEELFSSAGSNNSSKFRQRQKFEKKSTRNPNFEIENLGYNHNYTTPDKINLAKSSIPFNSCL